eukprot:4085502-Pyramimonas_sp.AAC.1
MCAGTCSNRLAARRGPETEAHHEPTFTWTIGPLRPRIEPPVPTIRHSLLSVTYVIGPLDNLIPR